jgi:hypothetical protein
VVGELEPALDLALVHIVTGPVLQRAGGAA